MRNDEKYLESDDETCAIICWQVLKWVLDGWTSGIHVNDFLDCYPNAVTRIKREFKRGNGNGEMA